MRSTGPLSRLPRSLSLGSAALVTAAMLAACRSDPEPGIVEISYRLGNNKTCAEVEVAEVEATLFKGSFEQPSVSHSVRLPCAPTSPIVIDDVPPESYEVRVIGFDASGTATFDNLGQSSSERVIEVFEDAESEFDAALTARPAELMIRWRLGDQGFGNCTGVGIARFEITAYQVGGGTELLKTVIDCDAAGDSTGYRLIPDPDRRLNGVLFGEVGIQALAANGGNVGLAAAFVFDPVGAGYPVKIGIECTEAGCISE